MKKVYFKNGQTLEITEEIANILRDNFIAGCGQFQCFSFENKGVNLIINVQEIVFIK